MKIAQDEIVYIQGRLRSMMDGRKGYPRWNLRDLAVVSRCVIIVNEHAAEHSVQADEWECDRCHTGLVSNTKVCGVCGDL